MPFIPNESDAAFSSQAAPDSTDIEAILAATRGTGVRSGGGVTAQGTPNMTVAVAAGVGSVDGSVFSWSAAASLAVAADATNPRRSIVVVSSAGTVSLVAGTPAASPVKPAVPTDSVLLAEVYVPAADTAVGSNQIGDKRCTVGATLGDWDESMRVVAASGSSLSLDPNLGNVQDVTLTANCTMSIINPPPSGKYQRLIVILRQDATGGRSVTWPASVQWSDGQAPVLQGIANQVEIVRLATVNGGTTWYGAAEVGSLGLATFSYTGAAQTWTVPSGVTEVVVEAHGAEGGKASGSALGGAGGRVRAKIGVTPGEVLQINVGGKGTDGMGTTGNGVGGAGGWNGGGAGGYGDGGASTNPKASGGGGASDVRQNGTALADRVVVAAGGGGASGLNTGGGSAFAASGPAGTLGTGANGSTTTTSGPGGGGGGGFYGGGAGNGSAYTGTGGPYAGGHGGADIGASGSGDGGVGGTQSAGGAGGSGTNQGGGGGGSNYVAPRADGVVSARGVRTGHGEVRISW